MKPFFSLPELAAAWGQTCDQVVDALEAMGVNVFYRGMKVEDLWDLRWHRPQRVDMGDGSVCEVSVGKGPPDWPEYLVLLSDLPESRRPSLREVAAVTDSNGQTPPAVAPSTAANECLISTRDALGKQMAALWKPGMLPEEMMGALTKTAESNTNSTIVKGSAASIEWKNADGKKKTADFQAIKDRMTRNRAGTTKISKARAGAGNGAS